MHGVLWKENKWEAYGWMRKFRNETDAIDTLVHLKDIIKAYGRVTVKDLMDLVGVAPNPDDDRLGWLNVDDTTINLIEQDKEHPYCLMLPHPVSFNDYNSRKD